MFKDKYIKDNEQIVPDQSVKRYIKSKLSGKKKTSFSVNKNAVVAVALSICLAVGVAAVARGTANVKVPVGEAVLNAQVTYDDIYDSINNLIKENRPGFWDYVSDGVAFLTGGTAKDIMVEDYETTASEIAIGETADDGTDPGANTNGSSSTNNQVQGVDEADIVKNDGRYIYTLKNGQLIIADSNSGDPKLLATKQVTQYNESAQSMFVNGNKLAVIVSAYDQSEEATRLRVFNIENKTAPYEISTVDQSGRYTQTRMIGSTLYLLSNHRIRSNKPDKDKPEEYVPCIDYTTVPAKDISVIENFSNPTYLVISATDITTGKSTASEAVLGGAENVYADGDSLYYTFSNYRQKGEKENEYKNTTTIVKLALDPADITTVATGNVDGTPLNQFSMDEYEGNLRIVTTVENGVEEVIDYGASSSYVSWTSSTDNALYVLDKELKIIGKIEDLAETERVYSVRFDGSIGYFVTFRQTDPLFTVDLSDPENPTVLSELKIPGFSEYLHPFGEDLLFGFGKSATEQGSVTGLKISMFDVSNPADVTENHVTPIEASWSEASSNHKAIMVDYGKNIIAFVAADVYGISRMYVYGYDANSGFFLKNQTVLESKYAHSARFVWIGEYFYLVTQNDITAFSLSDFTKTAYIQF